MARKINWTNTLFLAFTHVVGAFGTLFLLIHGGVPAATWWFALVYFIVGALSITVGYHRLFAHRAYKAVWPVRLVLLLLGAGTFEGSAIEWCTDHRRHHLYTDTDKDPYNIKQGFWHAHMGWLFFLDRSKRDLNNVTDLTSDPLTHFQHRFFLPLGIMMGFIVPMAIAASWGDAWGGLVLAGALRIALNYQSTFCINSVCHMFGKRTYSDKQSACDHWFTAFFTFGEGFHNFHHQFALDYRNGVRAYHYDPSKWVIYALSLLGLTRDLKRVSKEQIIRYRLIEEERKLLQKSEQYSPSHVEYIHQFIVPLRERVLTIAARIERMRKDYQALKADKVVAYKGRLARYHAYLAVHKKRLKKTKAELKNAMEMWTLMLLQCSSRA